MKRKKPDPAAVLRRAGPVLVGVNDANEEGYHLYVIPKDRPAFSRAEAIRMINAIEALCNAPRGRRR